MIRKGGILCGHDFNMSGVNKAVNEAAKQLGEDIHHYFNPEIDVWAMYL